MEEPQIMKKRKPPSSPQSEKTLPKPRYESVQSILGDLAKISLLDIMNELAKSNGHQSIGEILQLILSGKPAEDKNHAPGPGARGERGGHHDRAHFDRGNFDRQNNNRKHDRPRGRSDFNQNNHNGFHNENKGEFRNDFKPRRTDYNNHNFNNKDFHNGNNQGHHNNNGSHHNNSSHGNHPNSQQESNWTWAKISPTHM